MSEHRLSAFVNGVLHRYLQRLRLGKYLAEPDEEFGPVPEELREEARREWDAIESSWNEERWSRSRPDLTPVPDARPLGLGQGSLTACRQPVPLGRGEPVAQRRRG
jgi:hypothetical protein